jgi:UDP-N-acetylmuramoyl-L-alanyl-D-glutamate--2,6-diaminopimelate ligase
MKLAELIKSLGPVKGDLSELDFEVKGVSCDSRKTAGGFVFVAIKGTKADGSEFVGQALQNGAQAIVLRSEGRSLKIREKNKVLFIEVPDDRKALAALASSFYGDPSKQLKVIGVTGTNGKTTVTYLIEAILKECGFVPGVIGTINCRYRNKIMDSGNTTPGPLDLQAMLKDMRDSGVTHAVMEVSSHALDQGRTENINFSSAIFTNLTQDHLDYHKNMEDYFLAKSKLFSRLSSSAKAIINSDDDFGSRLKKLSRGKVITYGIEKNSDVRAFGLDLGLSSSELILRTKKGQERFKIKLIGKHNLYNVLAAFSWAQSEALDPVKIKRALEKFDLVPGRLEKIDLGKDFSVFVDYAHTEDALFNVLNALSQLRHKRIIVVFGCGGERDKSKRPKMGKVVSQLADYAIITNDNPRSEEPEQIIKEIKAGIKKDNFCVIPERMKAIKKSLSLAKKGDIVLVAGKGHEDYQILKDRVLHFDDREAVRRCLRSKS